MGMSKSEIEFAAAQAEKLRELLNHFDEHCVADYQCESCPAKDDEMDCQTAARAAFLVDNGVTIPVFCKECVHRKERVCFNPSAGMWVGVELKDSDFCSYGERRTDNGS